MSLLTPTLDGDAWTIASTTLGTLDVLQPQLVIWNSNLAKWLCPSSPANPPFAVHEFIPEVRPGIPAIWRNQSALGAFSGAKNLLAAQATLQGNRPHWTTFAGLATLRVSIQVERRTDNE
jgi:hypothetical protein